MANIKYIGPHGPTEIRQVPEKYKESFLKTGVYEEVGDNLIVVKPSTPKNVPDKSWTEKEIYAYIQVNNIDIDYNIKKDTKTWVLNELKTKGVKEEKNVNVDLFDSVDED